MKGQRYKANRVKEQRFRIKEVYLRMEVKGKVYMLECHFRESGLRVVVVVVVVVMVVKVVR